MTMMNKEKNLIQLLLLLGICVAYISASVIPDAVFVELDHDLHDVRDKRLKRDNKEKIKVTKVERNVVKQEEKLDDFDLAAQEIFDHVENAEKTVLTAAGDFIKNEVDFFFSNHNMGQADEVIHQYGGRRGANLRKKKNTKKPEVESKHDRMVHIINEYTENDME